MDSGQVEKDEEGKWLRSEEVDSMDYGKDEHLTFLTLRNRKQVCTEITIIREKSH